MVFTRILRLSDNNRRVTILPDVRIEKLCGENAEQYIKYLKKAFADEPEMMTADNIDDIGIKKRINAADRRSVSLLAVLGGEVVGRLEYHFYDCIQDGYKMAYVNWVYVQKEYRHNKIAQSLFKTFEDECKKNNINEYFLIRAKNKNAVSFYNSFSGAKQSDESILRKTIKTAG